MLDTDAQRVQANRFDRGQGLLSNMTALNLGRLFGSLVDPDRNMTKLDVQVAEHAMNEISGGAKTQNNPHHKHKEEGKPSLKKDHEHSGTQPSKTKKKHGKFPSALRPRES